MAGGCVVIILYLQLLLYKMYNRTTHCHSNKFIWLPYGSHYELVYWVRLPSPFSISMCLPCFRRCKKSKDDMEDRSSTSFPSKFGMRRLDLPVAPSSSPDDTVS